MTHDDLDEREYEDEERPDLDNADDDEQVCIYCNGSGEGQYDGTRCWSCKGSGVDHAK